MEGVRARAGVEIRISEGSRGLDSRLWCSAPDGSRHRTVGRAEGRAGLKETQPGERRGVGSVRQAMNKGRNRRRGEEDENKKKITSAGGSGSGRGSGVGMGGQARQERDQTDTQEIGGLGTMLNVPCPQKRRRAMHACGIANWLHWPRRRPVDLQQLKQALGPLGHTQLGSGRRAKVLTSSLPTSIDGAPDLTRDAPPCWLALQQPRARAVLSCRVLSPDQSAASWSMLASLPPLASASSPLGSQVPMYLSTSKWHRLLQKRSSAVDFVIERYRFEEGSKTARPHRHIVSASHPKMIITAT